MGWWAQTPEGASLAFDTDMLWGDTPADIMSDAIEAIQKCFERDWGRKATAAEIMAGVKFSLGELGES